MIVLVGVSHRTAPIEVREALAFPKDRIAEALVRLREEAGFDEAMILSTCNRVELYGRPRPAGAGETAGGTAGDPASMLEAFLARFHGRDPAALGDAVYRLSGSEAVRHAFRVAASLESMVVGEPQILGQVKEAYHAAEAAGTLGGTLNALRNRTLAAAKRARTETGIGRNAVSIAHVAVELAKKIFGDLRDRNVLLVGAGKMSQLAARTLVRSGARATVLGGRTFEKANDLAAALGGRAAPFEALRAELSAADIVISGTGAPGTVIGHEDVVAARRGRKGRQHRPLFLIDIAVPRDIEASVARLGGVFLNDLDDLRAVAEANLRERMKEAAAAETLIDREVHEFLDWFKARDAVPLVLALRQRAEDIRRLEMEKARRRMGPLTPEQEEALDAATTAIVNKLLHSPIVHIKESAQNGHGPEQVSLIRKLLGL